MPNSTMTYALAHIRAVIPPQLLELAFTPRQFNTTIEQRIISEVVEKRVLGDCNLVGGRRRDILIQPHWRLNFPVGSDYSAMGQGVDNTYYLIPPEAREFKNISSVIGLTPNVTSAFSGTGLSQGSAGSFGNTAVGMLSGMINSRTFDQYSIAPRVTLEGTNIICFYPELMVDGVSISVMLEYDSEFTNMNESGIFAMRNLCLCAVQQYIFTNLRVPVDETEVVAGMEIGVIKELIIRYGEEAEKYQEFLIKLKGAMHADARNISRIIFHAL